MNQEKERIIKLIDSNIDKALEELSAIFGTSNGIYNDLIEEYISRSQSFSKASFRSQLKAFIRLHLPDRKSEQSTKNLVFYSKSKFRCFVQH